MEGIGAPELVARAGQRGFQWKVVAVGIPKVGITCDGAVTRGSVDGIEETGAKNVGSFVFFSGIELCTAAGCDLFSLGHGLGSAFVLGFVRILADIISAQCDGVDQGNIW